MIKTEEQLLVDEVHEFAASLCMAWTADTTPRQLLRHIRSCIANRLLHIAEAQQELAAQVIGQLEDE